MNEYQITYALALLALAVPAWGRQRYVWACLWFNLLAMLSVCLAMDLGLDKETSRLSMMIVDLATGVALAIRPGLARVIAAGYAVTVPMYAPIISGFFTQADEGFTIVYIVASLQLGALAVGAFGGNGGGGGRRLPSREVSLAIPLRGAAMAGRPISADTCDGQG